MNKCKKTIAALAALTASTITVVHLCNRLLDKKAVSKNLLNEEKMHTFSWRFGKVCYSKTGTGAPLLLLHELSPCSNSQEWAKLIPALSRKYTVYAIDMPGCGCSDRLNITYTNFYYVQLITEFAKSIIQEPLTLMATGLSASLAVTSCSYDPSLFKKLILINPSDLWTLAEIPTRKSKAAKGLLEVPCVGTLLYHLIVSRNKVEREFRQRLFFDSSKVTDREIDLYYESSHRDHSQGKYLYASIIGNYLYFNISHALKSINNDIVIIGGSHQEFIDETMAQYKGINPAVESVLIPNTRHLPHLEDPEAVLKQLEVYC